MNEYGSMHKRLLLSMRRILPTRKIHADNQFFLQGLPVLQAQIKRDLLAAEREIQLLKTSMACLTERTPKSCIP